MPLDLSKFPLLKPDEVPFHSLSTLSAAEKELYDTSRDASLLALIQRELASRRVNALLFGDDDGGEQSEQEVAIGPESQLPVHRRRRRLLVPFKSKLPTVLLPASH